MKRLVILGSTGSIGKQTLEVVAALPDRFRVIGLAAGRRVDDLLAQAQRFAPRYLAVDDTRALSARLDEVSALGARVVPVADLAALPDADLVVVATVGGAGLEPVLAALAAGHDVALANKEVIVAAGTLLSRVASRTGARILPIDSEPSAIWQCLLGEGGVGGALGRDAAGGLAPCHPTLRRLILTASGGAFRDWPADAVAGVRPRDALRHPTWQMGPKITVDAATMMNKGLEVIEAHWLFGASYDQIEVVLHRESIVHSLVEFIDGSVKAQCSPPDMRLPIQYALTYPERLARPGAPRLDLTEVGSLTFSQVPAERYPCLALAFAAGRRGGTYPAALSGANEEAVASFLAGSIAFTDIAPLVAAAVEAHVPVWEPDTPAVLAADRAARAIVHGRVKAGASRAGRTRTSVARRGANAPISG